ncbi:MAG: hypothetical protein R2755_09350 [Acidimicrobiales bacterium]
MLEATVERLTQFGLELDFDPAPTPIPPIWPPPAPSPRAPADQPRRAGRRPPHHPLAGRRRRVGRGVLVAAAARGWRPLVGRPGCCRGRRSWVGPGPCRVLDAADADHLLASLVAGIVHRRPRRTGLSRAPAKRRRPTVGCSLVRQVLVDQHRPMGPIPTHPPQARPLPAARHRSEQFRRNRADMEHLLGVLAELHHQAAAGGGPKSHERLAARGQDAGTGADRPGHRPGLAVPRDQPARAWGSDYGGRRHGARHRGHRRHRVR